MSSWNMSSAGPTGAPPPPQGDNFGQSQPPRMLSHSSSHSYNSGGPLSDNTPTLNHLLQSTTNDPRQKTADPTTGAVGGSSSYNRDDYPGMNPSVKGEPYESSQSMYMSSSMHHQQQVAGWGSHPRGGGGHQYMYQPQGPGPSMYPNQPGGGSTSDMSQGRRPPMGGSPYPQPGSQYMGGQQMAMGPGPQRFMMPGQMPNQMYNQSQMYMPPSQQQQQQQQQQQPPQQQPAPSVSPAGRALTPQLQQMQNMIANSPKQPSPALSISSDHGSTQSSKPGDEGPDIKSECLTSQEDSGNNGSNSLSHRPAPSPVGSASSRSNTPASIPGTQSGSPMPVRPPGQVDGQTNRMTQSPMATQGYNPGMMPPPNNMGYMPNAGKMPGHYPPYNASQYPPQGNYSRQQSGMGGPGGMSGPMGGNYHSSQQGMYPNGPSQMQGNSGMYGGNMGWNMPPHSGYGPGPGPYQSGNNAMMGGGQYPGYGSHVPPMPGQQPPHNMQQQQQQQQQQSGAPMPPGSTANNTMPPGSTSGPIPPSMGGQQQQQQQAAGMIPQNQSSSGGAPMNKAAQAAQAAMMAAANSSVNNPRMPHNRNNSMSPSRSMFGGGPLAQMNNMTNSPNLGSPSLNSMSNAVEQLSRSASSTPSSIGSNNNNTNSGSMPPSMMSTGSIPSPGPKNSGMAGGHPMPGMPPESNGPATLGHHHPSPSPLSNPDPHESLSRPNSTTAIHPSDLPATHDTTSSESSSGGMPSDSTSVDSGFHSSDQGDKTSDSITTPNQMGVSSPPPPHSSSSSTSVPFGLHQNGETGRSVENITPPSSSSVPTSRPPTGHEPKMPYMNEGGNGIPLPPTSLSNSMTPMPPTDHCVTTTATFGHPTPSVTQSIASPVTSSSSSHHPTHMGGPPGHHGMMNPGMSPHGPPHHSGSLPNGMMSGGHMRGPHGQMHPGMGGGGPPPHGMMGGPNMNMNQNGPMMGPGVMGGPPMMGPNGGMMPPGSMGNSMPPHMGQMPQHPHQQMPHGQQQPPTQSPMVNNHPEVEQPPPMEKKKKVKDTECPIMPRSGYPGAHYSEEPNSPGVPKSSSDISKLFEMGPEPDRRPFIEGVLSFLEESGQPITSMPSISKTPLDLYKLYFCVRDKGGFEEVTRSKKWREICTVVNIGTSASAAFTLKKNYIRYLFNYECKYDRGGLNPGPILAQMEAQMAHKREQKNKRVPSPGSNNSNDAFRSPSTPNSQMEGPPYPPGMPPPYMQNPDSNMMMGPGPGGMMGPMGPNMMGPSPGVMGPGQPGMGGANVPPMMPGGHPHPGYGAPPMMQQHPQQQLHPQQQMPGGHPGAQQQQPPPPQTSNNSSGVPIPVPPTSGSSPMPVTSDSVSIQDPFSDESNSFSRNVPPAASTGTAPVSTMSSVAPPSYSTSTQPPGTSMAPSMGRPGSGGDTQTATARPNDQPAVSGSAGAQFPFGQQFDQPDRFDQSSPSSQSMRLPSGQPPQPPATSMVPSPQPSAAAAATTSDAFQQTPRFTGPPTTPHQSMPPSQYPPFQGQTPSYPPGPPYQGYPSAPGPYTPGPRPPVPTPGVFGTPTRRYPDAQDGGRDGQWSPIQRPRMQSGAPGYMSPGPPSSTPPMGTFGRSTGGHRGSPQARGEGGRFTSAQKMNKSSFPNMMSGSMPKKELMFPADTVEGVTISTFKRRKLNSKDLAPFEAWRLMLSLKSGLLAESTWALDTLNILLYDDSTHSYFSLSSLPGLLEVLTEHLRHCLMQIFTDFDDLEEGFKKPERHFAKRLNGKRSIKSCKSHISKEDSKDCISASEEVTASVKNTINSNGELDIGASFRLEGSNYTLTSRKGLPVKFDPNPMDSSVLETKEWDLYTKFEKSNDHWLSGCGDLTEHIQTQFESGSTHQFLSGKFYRKRTRLEAGMDEEDGECNSMAGVESLSEEQSNVTENEAKEVESVEQCGASNSLSVNHKSMNVQEKEDNLESVSQEPRVTISTVDSDPSAKIKEESSCSSEDNPAASSCNHSAMCNGSSDHHNSDGSPLDTDSVQIKKEIMENDENKVSGGSENKMDDENRENHVCEKEIECEKKEANSNETKNLDNSKELSKESSEKVKDNVPVENGELEEPKLSPMTSTSEMNGDLNDMDSKEDSPSVSKESKKDEYEDCPPPVLKAECMDVDMSDTQILDDSQTVEEEEANDVPSLPLNSTLNNSSNGEDVNTNVMDTSQIEKEDEGKSEDAKKENCESKNGESVDETDKASKEMSISASLNESFVSETEEMSASFVAELMKEEECTEEESFQRDDPPLCVTEENRDELGRRCVCILNILRSLSNVPGNESQLCKHTGVMKILGRLLLLHHSHPKRPPPRKLPKGDEDEKEEPPRVYDDEHWWWDYLDQLRENTLVILANICSHLMLGNFSEQLCYPLLEGLLHWVICPASVSRDPLPTLSTGSSLSPQRLVLEALCKLCIHETNVDLLLATPPMKRLLELFGVLVNLLADRDHQITREFSIVLLSLLVQGDSSVARALALQHPCVSVLVDFIETAEKNALNIANQQGLPALQTNPEAMGTSLDMLRRAASILLHMARVPDNRKLFIQQQNRLLNLVMSQILDQSVANTLSEVLFECSQVS